MNTQEINKQLDDIEAGIKTLRERADEVEKKLTERKGKWIPEFGDRYWFIDHDGDIYSFENTCTHVDKSTISIGNYYRTEAEAILARDNLITHEELSRLADYDGYGYYWTIAYGNTIGVFAGAHTGDVAYSYDEPRFASQESGQAAIEQIGEARLRKYLVGE